MTQNPTDALRLVPIEPTEKMLAQGKHAYAMTHEDDALRGAWAVMLAAAPASPLPEGGVEALIAELKEARGLLEEVEPLAICWATHYASGRGFEQHPQHKDLNANIRAFLARNGKGEG